MNPCSLTVVILTKNEGTKLPRCLQAIPRDYPVIVLDSGSTDETVALAKEAGCLVYSNPWRGFAAQRNFALDECGIETPWTLFIDADELYPETFYDWVAHEITETEGVDAVMVPSILFLRGKRLRYAPGYPIYHPRLVRTDTVRFLTNHTGHGESISEHTATLHATIPYAHYFYDGELIQWMHKHVEKACLEVRLRPTSGARLTRRGRISLLFGRSWLRIPARFAYHYLLRGGVFDGFAGLEFSLMFAWYEATIYLQAKTRNHVMTTPDREIAKWPQTQP